MNITNLKITPFKWSSAQPNNAVLLKDSLKIQDTDAVAVDLTSKQDLDGFIEQYWRGQRASPVVNILDRTKKYSQRQMAVERYIERNTTVTISTLEGDSVKLELNSSDKVSEYLKQSSNGGSYNYSASHSSDSSVVTTGELNTTEESQINQIMQIINQTVDSSTGLTTEHNKLSTFEKILFKLKNETELFNQIASIDNEIAVKSSVVINHSAQSESVKAYGNVENESISLWSDHFIPNSLVLSTLEQTKSLEMLLLASHGLSK